MGIGLSFFNLSGNKLGADEGAAQASRPVPAIDAAQPAKFETATFALG